MAAGQVTPNLRQVAAQDAARYGVPTDVFVRQIQQESGFNPNARSGAGAEGIAQFIPSTARSYGLTNPYDPVAALAAAAHYDSDLLHQYGTIQRALSAYNSGNPDAYQDPSFAGGQTYNYVRNILGGAKSSATAPPPAAAAAAPARVAPLPAVTPGRPVGNIGAALKLLGFAAPAAAPSPSAILATPNAAPPPRTPIAATSTAQAPIDGLVAGNTQGENNRFLQDLAQLAKFEGHTVDINSGYRSYAKQAQLYANRASNPNPVAAPGHSLHEQGLAADGTVNGIPLGTLPAAVLARFGLATVPGDPVHIQLAR